MDAFDFAVIDTICIIVFLIVLSILWMLLPFAVFGIKDRLDALIKHLKQTSKDTARQGKELAHFSKRLGAMHEEIHTSLVVRA